MTKAVYKMQCIYLATCSTVTTPTNQPLVFLSKEAQIFGPNYKAEEDIEANDSRQLNLADLAATCMYSTESESQEKIDGNTHGSNHQHNCKYVQV